MLGGVLREIIAYTPEAMARGSMRWRTLPLVPGVPERLVAGQERAFLTWFYESATAKPEVLTPHVADEHLRTFAGREGVLGAMGIHRAALTSIDQTEPLTQEKATVPVVATSGEKGPDAVIRRVLGMAARLAG